MLRSLFVPTLFVLLLAGCFSPGPEEGMAQETSAAAVAAAPDDPLASANASEPAAAPEIRTVPLSFSGSFPTFVEPCAWSPVTFTCVDLPPGAEFNNRFVLEERGNLTSLALTATWAPTSTATQELMLDFQSYAGEFSDFELLARVVGPSPLLLEAEDLVMEEGRTYRIFVRVLGTGVGSDVGGFFVAAAQEQPFTLEGTLTFAG